MAEQRRAVAAAIERGAGAWLAVRRPDEPGEELPGVWGLPATTLRGDESEEVGVARIGREKLGAELTAGQVLGLGEQDREGYTLRMTVREASITGTPCLPPKGSAGGTLYDALGWLPADSFRGAAERGSLCCAVFLETLAR